jgi:hypothetical protein
MFAGARALGFLFVSGERKKERNISKALFFIFFFSFSFFWLGPVHTAYPRIGGAGCRSLLLASSIQGRKAAAQQLRCRSTKMSQSVFKTNWLLSTCI